MLKINLLVGFIGFLYSGILFYTVLKFSWIQMFEVIGRYMYGGA
jgi:hypothetical protein